MYTMDHPKVIVSNQKEEPIGTLRVRTHYDNKFAHFQFFSCYSQGNDVKITENEI